MEQRPNNAEVMVAQTSPSREECVSGMVHRPNDAVSMDAQIELEEGEYALDMVQNCNNAAVMVARTKPSREECALGMGHSGKDAVSMDARTGSSREVCVSGMVQS